MSVGSPVACGSMRQRHSQEHSLSVGDLLLLEDDASWKTPRSPLLVVRRARTWFQVLVNIAWLTFAAFIVYYGDRRSNLISLLWSDGRIKRMALYLGLVGVVSNVGLILYTASPQKSDENYEALLSAAPVMVVLGFFSFFLISFALWPIWGLMTIPLLVTLLMSSMVLSPYLMIGPLRP